MKFGRFFGIAHNIFAESVLRKWYNVWNPSHLFLWFYISSDKWQIHAIHIHWIVVRNVQMWMRMQCMKKGLLYLNFVKYREFLRHFITNQNKKWKKKRSHQSTTLRMKMETLGNTIFKDVTIISECINTVRMVASFQMPHIRDVNLRWNECRTSSVECWNKHQND